MEVGIEMIRIQKTEPKSDAIKYRVSKENLARLPILIYMGGSCKDCRTPRICIVAALTYALDVVLGGVLVAPRQPLLPLCQRVYPF